MFVVIGMIGNRYQFRTAQTACLRQYAKHPMATSCNHFLMIILLNSEMERERVVDTRNFFHQAAAESPNIIPIHMPNQIGLTTTRGTRPWARAASKSANKKNS